MQIGDIVIPKHDISIFKKDEKCTILRIVEGDERMSYYVINKDEEYGEWFSDEDLYNNIYNHFYTIKELRDMKLKTII